MGDLTRRLSSKIFNPDATPATTIAIKVHRRALRSVVDNGLTKSNWFERNSPIGFQKWINVEAAEGGTNDSVFFVPEHPSIDQSHQRTLPAQYIKVNPAEHNDVVRRGDDFEVSFVGMSVAKMDMVGNNEILLCSLTREANSTLELETKPELFATTDLLENSGEEVEESLEELKEQSPESEDTAMPIASGAPAGTAAGVVTDKMSTNQVSDTANATAHNPSKSAAATSVHASKEKDEVEPQPMDPVKQQEISAMLKVKEEMEVLSELPTALTVQRQDIPFLHYDPEVDGHDTGTAPNSFVPIPGSKRVYIQRRGEQSEGRDVSFRFTVMEIDKLSEEQLIAIKSLDDIGKSVGKAAATVPYLKFISWILKFASFLGRSALKKVAEPEHVLSKDMMFILADPVEREASLGEVTGSKTSSSQIQREQYGNYLRYGYYFFLNTTVDAKLYAQTGASSQNVPLLLKRSGYNPKYALKNEREFFPMSGVSYVVLKVTRGLSPVDREQRVQMKNRHRTRLVKLLKKYTGKLEDAVGQ